jgi:hypothetical protein
MEKSIGQMTLPEYTQWLEDTGLAETFKRDTDQFHVLAMETVAALQAPRKRPWWKLW